MLDVHTHVHYNVRMNIYQVAEFRKKTKEALDQAKDEAVYIRRGDDLYKLVYDTNVINNEGVKALVFNDRVVIADGKNPLSYVDTTDRTYHKYEDEQTDDPTYTDVEPTA